MCHPVVNAIIKGFIEGFTEFLPISSTGHLVLVRQFFPLTADPSDAARVDKFFDIVVQFPAILAIAILYRQRLWTAACGVREKPEARRFWLGLFLAFLPAAAVGWCFHDQIKEKLFNPVVIAWALIAGGVVLLLADRKIGGERVARAEETPLGRAFVIGLCQCLALVPGTSRSGATIVGGRFLSLTREAAAEYSFFLALPTMGAACVYEFAKSLRDIQWATDGPVLLAGSLTSFVTAWVVVALFIRFLQKHGLGVFGYYRIVLGLLVLWLGRATAGC